MSTMVESLAEFGQRTTFETLPDRVVHEARRTVLDALGCGLASSGVAKGRMCIEVARRLGGPSESSIIGVVGKVSPTSAVLANGELINAMDFSSLFGRGGHATPNLVPAILAVGESVRAGGADIVRAVAVAHEVALRLSWGMSPIMTVHPADDGSQSFSWTTAYGFSRFNIGAAIGVGLLLGLDDAQLRHAIGLAGHHAQIPANAKFAHGEPPMPMTKYGTAGWQSTGAVISGLLAQLGYTGDLTLFEGDTGFWRMSGSDVWRPERVLDGIGSTWGYPDHMDYKPYPCCRLMQSALGAFLAVRDDEDLAPEEITAIEVAGHPYGAHPSATNRRIDTTIDAQFSIPYVFSVAAHRIPVGPQWQSEDTMRSERILDFMDRVSYDVHPDFYVAGSRAAQTALGSVRVETVRGFFERSMDYPLGSPIQGYRLDDEALVDKFRTNAAVVLDDARIGELTDLIDQLDAVPDINEVTDLWAAQ